MINVVPSKARGVRGGEMAKRRGGGKYKDVLVLACGTAEEKKKRRAETEAVIRESRASCALHLACRKSACTGHSALWPALLSVLTSVSHSSDLKVCYVFSNISLRPCKTRPQISFPDPISTLSTRKRRK